MTTSIGKTNEGELPSGDEHVNDQYGHESEEPDEKLMEALEDMKDGRYLEFDDVEDLIAELKS